MLFDLSLNYEPSDFYKQNTPLNWREADALLSRARLHIIDHQNKDNWEAKMCARDVIQAARECLLADVERCTKNFLPIELDNALQAVI